MTNPKSGFTPIIALLIVLAIGLGLGYILLKPQLPWISNPVYCTEEAKLCPDGSHVGRIPPTCQFSPCPTPSEDPTANWEIYTNEELNISFRFPNTLEIIEGTDPRVIVALAGPKGSEPEVGYGRCAEFMLNIGPISRDGWDNTKSYLQKESMPTNVNGINAVQLNWTDPLEGDLCQKSKIVLASDNQPWIESISIDMVDRNGRHSKLFNQILSTFRFLNKNKLLEDAERKTHLESLFKSALELYRLDYGNYPEKLGSLIPKYLTTLPTDPATNKEYLYEVSQDRMDYKITATLNDGSSYSTNTPKQ